MTFSGVKLHVTSIWEIKLGHEWKKLDFVPGKMDFVASDDDSFPIEQIPGTIWNPKQPFINGCFNWMIPNLYIGNCCFIKHLFINGCLGFQVVLFLGDEFVY